MSRFGEIPSGNEFAAKNNFTATTNPGVNDDDSQGYELGSLWINTTSPKIIWKCIDASTGTADWERINTALASVLDLTETSVNTTATGANWDDLQSVIMPSTYGETLVTMVFWSAGVENSLANGSVSCRVVIGGTPVSGTERTVKEGFGGGKQSLVTIACKSNVAQGTEIKIQWQVTSGTGTANGRNLQVLGIPSSLVK